MKEISLESVDKVIERTGVTYKEAKDALEYTEGDILEAIIYIESKSSEEEPDKAEQTVEEFKVWLKDLIKKGNISRIKIKKDDSVIVDVPVNAGIAVGVISLIMPSLLAFGVIAAVATKITIEITKADGTVEVVNKYVSKAANEVKDKASSFAETVKGKINEVKEDLNVNSTKETTTSEEEKKDADSVYTYTVNFEEDSKEDNKDEE